MAFTDEEGRFAGFAGSEAVIGRLTPERVMQQKDSRGITLAEAMTQAGLAPMKVAEARREPEGIKAYIELHIEQGPILESLDLPIGVVQGVVGLSRLWVTFRGRADHAGTTPIAMRKDAFLPAADFGLQVRELVLNEGSQTSVGTIGLLELKPGVVNIVPEQAFLTLDLRDISPEVLQRLVEGARRLAQDIAARWGVEVVLEPRHTVLPVQFSPHVQSVITQVAQGLGLATHAMNSGARHDAQIMASITQAGMIFVPSRHGRSHSSAEHTD